MKMEGSAEFQCDLSPHSELELPCPCFLYPCGPPQGPCLVAPAARLSILHGIPAIMLCLPPPASVAASTASASGFCDCRGA